MEARALQRHRRKAVILATACLAITLWSTSCGGGGSTAPIPTPGFSLSPTAISFGNLSVGADSAPLTATLTNVGNATLTFSSIQVQGPDATDYPSTNNCGSSLGASAQCTLTVTFKPGAPGTRTASVVFTDNAPSSPQSLSLSGTGTAAALSLSPTSVAFGTEPVDVTSSAQSVTLSNTGSAALSNISLTFTGTNASDFAENTTCGSSLAAGANCTIAVTFTPSIAGDETASLSVSDSASGSPQKVSLSGTGTHDVILSWDPSTTSGAVGYNVYRGTTSGGEDTTPLNGSPVATGCTSPTTCTYTDETAQAGQTYYYVVTAVGSNDVTQSADSNEVEVTVP